MSASPKSGPAPPESTSVRPTFRQRLEYLGLAFAIRAVGFLPYWSLRRLAVPLGSLVCALDRRGCRVARANLDAAFGETLTPTRKARITTLSYQRFARTMLELFWSPNLTRELLEKIGPSEGLDQSFHRDASQPVIYLCLHSSNFEWLSQKLAWSAVPGIVVAQRLKNPLLGPLFDRLRASTGHTVIPQERAMIRMLRHLKAGGSFCMVVDLNLDPNEASVIIDEFGGLKTCVTQMHAALASHTGARIIPAECRAQPDGTYRLIYHPPLEYPPDAKPAEIAQLCWNVLEPFIREEPESWLWSYKHWRFKPSGEDTSRYPFYANTAKRFDRMLPHEEPVPAV